MYQRIFDFAERNHTDCSCGWSIEKLASVNLDKLVKAAHDNHVEIPQEDKTIIELGKFGTTYFKDIPLPTIIHAYQDNFEWEKRNTEHVWLHDWIVRDQKSEIYALFIPKYLQINRIDNWFYIITVNPFWN